LGLANVGEDTMKWYRAAELKHARVTMLAALGLLVAPSVHLSDPVFDTNKGGLFALAKVYAERPEAIYQIITAIGAVEVLSLFKNGQKDGDLQFDPLNIKPKDEEQFKLTQLRELKKGRLAMLGASGLLLQEVVNGLSPYGN